MNDTFNFKQYFLTFLVTVAIFGGAILASNRIYRQQVVEMKDVANQISSNTAALEVQYNLLLETSCSRASDIDPIKDLDRLADMLAQAENQRGDKSAEVIEIKKEYSLLQIKDFLLTKRIADRCKQNANYILYFYSTEENCPDCKKQGWVLTDLRKEYPDLRIYAFDYDMDFPPLKTLRSMYKIEGSKLPALIIGDEVFYGFKDQEEMIKNMPFLSDIKKQREEENKKNENKEKLLKK